MEKQFDIPVLFIIFNRPDTTQLVFERIREVKPKQLFVAADGPRENNAEDQKQCGEARDIVRQIDWECELKTFYRDENVGCGRGPSEAITWFFEHVEMGIILEDDCVPSKPFFDYCKYLLEKYKHDERVWIVSGRSHYTHSKYFKTYDYVFSNYVITWGWATWKRAWENFKINMHDYWPEFYEQGGFKNVFFTKREGSFRNQYYRNKLISDKQLTQHVWDYQFLLNMNQNNGLGITPAKNLIENIGAEGTHFTGKTKFHEYKAANEFKIEKEPENILPNRQYETNYFYNDLKIRGVTFISNRIYRLKTMFSK